MKKWIKLTKYFQGGMHETFMYVDESEIDSNTKREELMENWGENSDGGHNYGYTINFSDENIVPTKKWLEGAIRESRRNINHILEELSKDERIKTEEDKIIFYNILKNEKV